MVASQTAIAVQMDPPSRLNPAGDSTICLMREAARRGYVLYTYTPDALSYTQGEVSASMQRLHIQPDAQDWFTLEAPVRLPLHRMRVVLMRQDPPFDMAYITATYLLDQLGESVAVVNNPTAVRSHAEKLLPLVFPEAMPQTLISADKDEVLTFLSEHRDIILKPLYGWGGHGVLRLREGGDNVQTLLEMLLTRRDGLPVMAQPFLPEVASHDIRVVLIGGKIAGAFSRTPASGEIRANMRVGGTPQACELSPTQQALCERIAPWLHERGLYLAGLDLIGEHLTEINVTSPTGLRALENLYGTTPAALFWDGLGL